MSDTAQKPDRGDGRTADGKFAPGNSISPGRRHAVRESQNLKRVREVIHLDRIAELAGSAFAIATDPTVKVQDRLRAMQLIFLYSLPQAGQRLDAELKLNVPDGTEFRVAGLSPSEVDRDMFEYIERLIQQQQEYEQEIQSKYPTNGKETP